jgi:uncharacterized membrane protein YbhN (UPF0104 family)
VRPFTAPLVGLVLLGVLLARLGTTAVTDALRSIDAAAVLAALGIGLVTTVLSAGRWCLVARALGLRLPLRRAVADCYRAFFLNSVLPAGVLGDVHRAVSHGRRSGDLGRGVRAVALERTAGLVVLVVIGVTVLATHPGLLAGVHGPADLAIAVTAAGLAGVLVLVGLLLAHAASGTRRGRMHTVLVTGLATGLADARAGVLSRRAWPGVVLFSAVAVGGYLVLFVVAARAAGSTASVADLLPLLVLALLAMGLPINVGGWGPREVVASVAFGTAGLTAAQGLATAAVYGVLSLIACLPGLGVLVLRRVRPATVPR